MNIPTASDYKFYSMTYRGWKRKISAAKITKKINAVMDKNSIDLTKVDEYYDRFVIGDTRIFPTHLNHTVSLNQQKGWTDTLIGSLVFVKNCGNSSWQMLTKNGQFFIFPQHCYESKQYYITIYDLFRGKEKDIPVSFDTCFSHFQIVGNYLLVIEPNSRCDLYKLHTLKINYEDLSVTKLEIIEFPFYFHRSEIVPDQLDEQKFIIWYKGKIMTGEICQNETVALSGFKIFEDFFTHGKRLMGHVLQFFVDPNLRSNLVEFHELNLNTKEEKVTHVPIELDTVNYGFPCEYCWQKDYFYGLFNESNKTYPIVMFDSKSLKWSTVKILENQPLMIFISENHVMTLKVGNRQTYGIYRVALRKPDTLMNLTRLTTVKEFNLFANEKYLNVSRQIQF